MQIGHWFRYFFVVCCFWLLSAILDFCSFWLRFSHLWLASYVPAVSLLPSSPARFLFFSIIDILMGYPAEASAEERERLPYRNQILARIMSLWKSILGKREFFKSTSMFRWRFLKNKINVLYCQLELPDLYVTATNNKEFTDLYVEFVLCRKQRKKN